MPWLSLLATLVDFGGTLVLIAVTLGCLRDYVRKWGAPAVLAPLQLRLAEGLVFALSFKTGAGVIRTVTVGSFRAFVSLLLIVALRFFLGYVLKAQIARREAFGKTVTPAPQ